MTPNTVMIVMGSMMLVIVVLVIFIWSIKRHRAPKVHLDCDGSIADLIPSLAGLTLSSAVAGNSVEVLENGAFFDVLLEHMSKAQKTLHFETFLWKEGTLGQRVVEVMTERARAGVKVRVLVDANGCSGMGKDAQRQLREAGCKLARFHDYSLKHIGVVNERDHRKLVVLDGRIAFVGGHCVVDSWLGDAEDGEHFADVSVMLRGPIVGGVQAAFSENWGAETGELIAGDDVFPELENAGEVRAHVVYAKPEGSAPAVKILHHSVICLARKRLWIQNPYFIPEPEAVEALGKAVARGVDVRVMMPSTSGSDNPMVQHAGHWNFDKLLRLGVRLFEYPHTLLHQKVVTVDGVWSAVGSSNFDDRSFEINDELTVGILDEATAKRLDAVFERYMPRCKEIRLEEWRRRSLLLRVREAAAYAINELL
ncbi:MAG TPA: phospholipase D-like domain-containing protein [Candidatus Binatia bacterium]|nr:phospholipase D-like domain-containing protein [Candidatus Binatia bacterium]